MTFRRVSNLFCLRRGYDDVEHVYGVQEVVLAREGENGECEVEDEELEGAVVEHEQQALHPVLEPGQRVLVLRVYREEPDDLDDVLRGHLDLLLLEYLRYFLPLLAWVNPRYCSWPSGISTASASCSC